MRWLPIAWVLAALAGCEAPPQAAPPDDRGPDEEPPSPWNPPVSASLDEAGTAVLDWALGVALMDVEELRGVVVTIHSLADQTSDEGCPPPAETTQSLPLGSRCAHISEDPGFDGVAERTQQDTSWPGACSLGDVRRSGELSGRVSREDCSGPDGSVEDRTDRILGAGTELSTPSIGTMTLSGRIEAHSRQWYWDDPSSDSQWQSDAEFSWSLPDPGAPVESLLAYGPVGLRLDASRQDYMEVDSRSRARHSSGVLVAAAASVGATWTMDWEHEGFGDPECQPSGCELEPEGTLEVHWLPEDSAAESTAILTWDPEVVCDGCGGLTLNGEPAGLICRTLPI